MSVLRRYTRLPNIFEESRSGIMLQDEKRGKRRRRDAESGSAGQREESETKGWSIDPVCFPAQIHLSRVPGTG